MNALLGEMTSVGGQVLWANDVTVAYAAQKPWLLNNTVKNNVLFGQPFIRERYKSILEACALKSDLEILPAGKCLEEIIRNHRCFQTCVNRGRNRKRMSCHKCTILKINVSKSRVESYSCRNSSWKQLVPPPPGIKYAFAIQV